MGPMITACGAFTTTGSAAFAAGGVWVAEAAFNGTFGAALGFVFEGVFRVAVRLAAVFAFGVLEAALVTVFSLLTVSCLKTH